MRQECHEARGYQREAGGTQAHAAPRPRPASCLPRQHDPDGPEDIRTLESNGQRYENLQIGFLIASGVLATTGIVLYVISRPDGCSATGARWSWEPISRRTRRCCTRPTTTRQA